MKHLILSTLFAIMLIAGNPSAAKAQDLFSGTLDAAFGMVGGRINDMVEDRINQVFDRFDSSALRVRGHAEAILASARAELNVVLDKTFDELTQQQRMVAEVYFNALQETEDSIARSISNGSALALDLGQIGITFNPLAGSPIVLGLSTKEPLFDDTKGKVIVVITGLNIGDSRNRILTPTGWVNATNTRDNEIEFPVEVDMASAEDDNLHLIVEIHDAGIIRTNVRRIPLTLPAQPNALGQIAAVYTTDSYNPVSRMVPPEGQPRFSRKCSGGGTSRCTNNLNEPITPSSGYEIIVDTVEVHATFSNRCASGKGFRREAQNVTPNGFRLHVWAKSSRGRSCSITGWATFQERPRSPSRVESRTEFSSFYYREGGLSFSIPVNANLIGFVLVRDGSETETPLPPMSPLWRLRSVWSPGTTAVELIPAN